MQRAAVIGESGACRRALRALLGRGIEAVALPPDADALVVLDAIRAARADAVWLAAVPLPLCKELSARCAGLGIAVVGPSAQAIEGAGDAEYISRILGTPSRQPARDARLVEALVAADAAGAVCALALSQRLGDGLDEAPAALPLADATAARSAAESLCRALGWTGVGVVEMAFDEQGMAVRGVATASSAEAAVEEATGLDLVELRLSLHLGEPVPALPSLSRAAFSACVRVPAAAAASEVLLLRLPGGPGVRAESRLAEGESVPAGAEAHVATVSASGADRAEALRRLEGALEDCAIAVRGRATNRAAILAALGARPRPSDPGLARTVAAILEYQAAEKLELERFLAQARRGRPRTDDATGRAFDLCDSSGRHRTRVARIGPGEFRVDGRIATVELCGRHQFRVSASGKTSGVLHSCGREPFLEIDGVGHVVERDRSGVVVAPMPAVVQRILVQAGDLVAAGQPLLVLEAMKLEASVAAQHSGRVHQIMVSANQQVARDAPLLSIVPDGEAASEVVREQPLPAGDRDPAAELRRLLLGYDDDGWDAASLSEALRSGAEEAEDARAEDAELKALSTFAALAAVFRREHDGDARPPFEHLLRYLRTPEARGEGLPATFLELLDAALAEQGASRSRPS
ncbi:MAG TPA: biotin/lipoyl-containing protein, partial [Myxococcales bacterium]